MKSGNRNPPNFQSLTKRLLQSASGGRIRICDFERLLPGLASQIRCDVQSPWLRIWGRSLNYDEHEKKIIVDRKILNVIGRIARCKIRDKSNYHAGLIHTYGYLLSNLPTRYGFKRERWINGQLERCLGLSIPLLPASPGNQSLLQNLSYLLHNFVGQGGTRNQLARETDYVAPTIVEFDYSKIRRKRILENVQVGQSRRIELRTDLISLPKGDWHSLLIYSHQYNQQVRIITTFPIGRETESELLKQETGRNVLIRPRFNLFFPGLPRAGMKGTRTVQ